MRAKNSFWIVIILLSLVFLALFFIQTFRFSNNRSCIPDKWSYTSSDNYESLLELEEIEAKVENYIRQIDTDLSIGDIFIYEDADYYFSIEESDTEKGAFELLVNPYTGVIYPESGPNMMWNEKYGMRNRMRNNFFSNNNDAQISRDEAVMTADNYVKRYISKEYAVSGEGHEFYGYYTFHIQEGGRTLGMLSVNYYTGDVWYHDWHGKLIEVISHHSDE